MNNYFNLVTRILIRISAFLRKEIVEIMRQPMLVLTLVLGPFLILLFFSFEMRLSQFHLGKTLTNNRFLSCLPTRIGLP